MTKLKILRCGDELEIDEIGCKRVASGEVYLLRFSQKFKTELTMYLNRNFVLQKAKVYLVLHWKDDSHEYSAKIVLPEVHLIEASSTQF